MKLFLAALTLFAGTMPAAAQWMDYPWPDIPRAADGTPDLTAPAPRGSDGRPDLSGVWNGPRPVTRLDPANLQPWVTELVRQRQQEYYRTRPLYQCQPSGPEAERFGSWKRILQTPTAIAILNDDLTYRVIHTDGRELEADPFPTWAGYSVGRWDGDTLVVESNGFNDKTWVSRYGISHTEALRITERYRRTDFGHLQVEVTYTDPDAFTQPWGFTLDMELMADSDMLESVCERGSEDWAGSLSDAAGRAVSVPPEVLARYVGVYTGIYAGKRAHVRGVTLRRPTVRHHRGRLRLGGPGCRRPRRGRDAAAGAAIRDGVRRPGARIPVHRRRPGCGDGPHGGSRVR